MTKRVAIVGASGIGRHHARWWQVEGASICAFLGRSESSVAATAVHLQEHLGVAVPGYTDMARILREARPDIVDICSPPHLHAEHVALALEAGAEVLCEKPFVYDPTLSSKAMLEQARGLMAHAAELEQRLCICTQYAVGAPILRDFFLQATGARKITSIHGQLAAPAKGRGPDPQRIWIDLAPHLLSVVLALYPDAERAPERLAVKFDGYRAEAAFVLDTPEGAVPCRLECANRTEPPNNIRRFTFNDQAIDVAGEQAADGEFGMRLRCREHSLVSEDMMRLLIRRFLAGEMPVAPEQSLQNLALMLEILDCYRGS